MARIQRLKGCDERGSQPVLLNVRDFFSHKNDDPLNKNSLSKSRSFRDKIDSMTHFTKQEYGCNAHNLPHAQFAILFLVAHPPPFVRVD